MISVGEMVMRKTNLKKNRSLKTLTAYHEAQHRISRETFEENTKSPKLDVMKNALRSNAESKNV